MVFIIKSINRVIDYCFLLLLIAILLIAAIGLYDSYYLMKHAGADNYGQYHNETIDFKKLKELNPDVVSWLTVKGTHIDYPIVQGKTNLDYINKSVEGDYSLSGSVFLDCRNKADFSDPYSIIYAHHMDGAAMFGELPNFEKESFFKKYKTAFLYFPSGTKKKLKLFACLKTDAYDNLLFNPTGIRPEILSTEFLPYIKQKSIQYRTPKLDANSHIVALSTCEDTTTDGRVMVLGILS
ncbi:class B sortase [Enterococcus faecium]|uniref:SrtB family sortase n=1 Tax=Enterococcus faecium TaxID=1352 RepID=A0A242B0J8_ENTFC|nr:class B sortase [Enterococcus faecium]OTN86662.1 SrtB family sortase [Enterococcus faecium]OTN86675.1 SrtB family sortase [Enterococcus faecium]OTN94485.1 SrtB family sortase [Enterococcus faecium]